MRPYFGGELQPDMLREISCLTVLSPHPDIVRLLDWALPNYKGGGKVGEVSIVLELGEMSLSDAIRRQLVGGDTPVTKLIMFQLLRGVAYMNSLDIWHRDLKPGNVLVKRFKPYPDVKIADFGLARAGPYCYVTPTEIMYTLWYRPPEILIREVLHDKTLGDNYDEKAEVWALGMVMWDLLTAERSSITRHHLRGKDIYTQLWRVIRGVGVPRERDATPFGWDPDVLMRKLGDRYRFFRDLQKTDGMSLKTVFGGGDAEMWDLLTQMLALNAAKRISVYDALNHPYFVGVHQWLDRQPDGEAPIPKAPASCFSGLLALQRVEDTPTCLDAIPGDDRAAKLMNWAKVSALMNSFLALESVAQLGDVAVFALAIQLTICALGTRAVTVPDFHAMATLGLSCMSLASKYLARRPVGIGAVAHSLGEAYKREDVAQYEALLFRILGGQLHLPTSYRMLVALVGCPALAPKTAASKLHASIFAWAVGLLHIALCTVSAFAGTPAELAMLAAQLSTHYHRMHDVSDLPGCCSSDPGNRLCLTALRKGAEMTHTSFKSFPPKVITVLLESVTATIKLLSPFPLHDLTPEGVLQILEGKATVDIADLDETTTEEASSPEELVKRKPLQIQAVPRKRYRIPSPPPLEVHKRGVPYPLLSPDLTLSDFTASTTKTATTTRLPVGYFDK